MKQLYPLFGIVTVLNTPFTRDNTLDLPGLRRNVKLALSAGVAGFLVPAMASEVYKLSTEERLQMVDTVLDEVNGTVPVIAGAGEPDLSKARSILKEYIRRGCKNVLFQIPYTGDDSFYSNFMSMAALEPEMIMLQDWDATGSGLPDALICRLFDEVPAFRCLKVETVPAGPKYSRIIKATSGKLNVSGGWAVTQMIEGLKRGVHAFMPTGMHYTYCRIYRAYKVGNHAEAESLFLDLLPVLAFSNQHLDISIHFFKHLLHRQGIYDTPIVRDPTIGFDEFHMQQANQLIDKVIALEKRMQALSLS